MAPILRSSDRAPPAQPVSQALAGSKAGTLTKCTLGGGGRRGGGARCRTNAVKETAKVGVCHVELSNMATAPHCPPELLEAPEPIVVGVMLRSHAPSKLYASRGRILDWGRLSWRCETLNLLKNFREGGATNRKPTHRRSRQLCGNSTSGVMARVQ